MSDTTEIAPELAGISSDIFNGSVGNEFTLVSGGVTMPVRLADCRENYDAMGPDTSRTPFLLILHAEEDSSHPMQQAKEFHCDLQGLEQGPISGLFINRTLRPTKMPPGAYYQIIFG